MAWQLRAKPPRERFSDTHVRYRFEMYNDTSEAATLRSFELVLPASMEKAGVQDAARRAAYDIKQAQAAEPFSGSETFAAG